MILFFLSSGLFLGWSLGANDAANIFGSAVGSRMVSFRKAAIIASIFVILGAVFQGEGASHTLGKLGAVNAIGGSFTVALAAAITVYGMTRAADTCFNNTGYCRSYYRMEPCLQATRLIAHPLQK